MRLQREAPPQKLLRQQLHQVAYHERTFITEYQCPISLFRCSHDLSVRIVDLENSHIAYM